MVMIISLDHGDDDYNLTSTGEDWVVLVRGNFLQLFLFSPIKLFLFPPSYITNHPPKAFPRFSFFRKAVEETFFIICQSLCESFYTMCVSPGMQWIRGL